MTNPAVLQSAGSGLQSPAAATVSATYGTSLTAGSKLIAFCYLNTTSSSQAPPTSVKDGSGNSFTQVAATTYASGLSDTFEVMLSVWVLDTPSGDAGTTPTVTASLPTGVDSDVLIVQEVSGLAAGTAVVDGTPASTIAASSAGPYTMPSYTSAAAGEMLYSLAGEDGPTDTLSASSGWTLDSHSVQSNGNCQGQLAYKLSTGGAESGTWTASPNNSINCTMMVLALKVPSPAVTTTANAGAATVSAAAGDAAAQASATAGLATVTAQAGAPVPVVQPGAGQAAVTAQASAPAGAVTAAAGAAAVSAAAGQPVPAVTVNAGAATVTAAANGPAVTTGTVASAGAATVTAAANGPALSVAASSGAATVTAAAGAAAPVVQPGAGQAAVSAAANAPAVTVALSDSDACAGADGEAVTRYDFSLGQALVSPAWLTRWGRQRFPRQAQGVFLPAGTTSVTDADHGLGGDAEIDNPFPVETDASGPAADGGEAVTAVLRSAAFTSDAAGPALDGEVQPGASGSDAGHGAEAGFLSSAQFADGETARGTDRESARFGPDAGPSDGDAGAGSDQEIIDVYAYQPPFRWTGGQFSAPLRPRFPVPAPEPPPGPLHAAVVAEPALRVTVVISADG